MKSTFFAAATLLSLVAAQPAGSHRKHIPYPLNRFSNLFLLPGRQHQHAHREVVDVVTATAPQVDVYVNAQGQAVSTSTEGLTAPTAAVHAAAVPAAAPAKAAPPAVQAQAPAVKASSNSASTSGSVSSGSASGQGIVYSPYHADHSCKTQDEVNNDFKLINGYKMVRIYGVDCNQVATVGSAAKAKGMKLFAGIFDVGSAAEEIATLISAVHSDMAGDFSMIDTISVGNEIISSQGVGMIPAVLGAIEVTRAAMKLTGYTGHIVTVDVFNTMMANPVLCKASDYAAVNGHAFFDSTCGASNAGQWAIDTVQGVSSACGGMKTVLTESGWPSFGTANGAAVPSPENQAAAVKSLLAHFSDNIFVLSAFNDGWKSDNAGTFGAEKFYGIMGDSPN